MRVIIETANPAELEKIMVLFKSLHLEEVKILPPHVPVPVRKGNKKIDPSGLFGIWQKNPRTLEEIRRNDWQRDWNI